eukprot:COSAG06_NODE_19169_length_850_cov_3.753662_1_plen_24_part_10
MKEKRTEYRLRQRVSSGKERDAPE